MFENVDARMDVTDLIKVLLFQGNTEALNYTKH